MTLLKVDIAARRSNARHNPGLGRRFYFHVEPEEAKALLHFADMRMPQSEVKQLAISRQ